MTGVDRVELAYARHLGRADVPCFGLVRSPLGYILIGPDDLVDYAERAGGFGACPAPDLVSLLGRNQSYAQRAALTLARQKAVARCTPRGLPNMLGKHLPTGTAYFNVGHSNLTERVLGAAKSLGPVSVLVHDIIPLRRPADQRPGTVEVFEGKIRRVSTHADRVICNSKVTAEDLADWLLGQDLRVPECVVAHLGTEIAQPAALPEGLPPDPPYFVTVGTIEPRKNHSFLLDLWAEMGPEAPTLVIAGSRGWANEAVFRRLDAEPANVMEVSGLTDGALTALIAGAQGVLFPSLAEGFGWPPVEAAAAGVPVVVNDLDIYREVMGNIPIYAPVRDRYLWVNEINKLAAAGVERQGIQHFEPPSWDAHFKVVLRLT